eukprot:SAG25_NODE_64_length_17680_cov_5.716398_1_plen_1172_part_00
MSTGAGNGQNNFEFFNNSAHLCGTGWHIFPGFGPSQLNTMSNFTLFRCGQGSFYYSTNNLNHEDHRYIECGSAAAVLWTGQTFNSAVLRTDPGEPAPFFTDVVLVGNIDDTATHSVMRSGLSSWDANDYWFVSGLYAKNMWDRQVLSGCHAFGCTMRYERCKFVNSNKRTLRKGIGIFWDLDGTLTGFPHGFVVANKPYNRFAGGPCHEGTTISDSRGRAIKLYKVEGESGHYNSHVCGRLDGSVRVRLLKVSSGGQDGTHPWQLYGQPALVQTSAGSELQRFVLTAGGWPLIVLSDPASWRTYDFKIQVPNDFQDIFLTYANNDVYSWVMDGFNWSTPVSPVVEGVKFHFNYSHWRDHFEGNGQGRGQWKNKRWITSTTGTLPREPTMTDNFGDWSHKIWAEDCARYQYTNSATERMCTRPDTNGYTLQSPPHLKWVMNQQPDLARAEGRVTTALTTHNASSVRGYQTIQGIFAKECPVAGCEAMPVGWSDVAATNKVRRWSNASSWTCGKLSNVSTLDTCVERRDANGEFSIGNYKVILSTVSFRVPGPGDDVYIAFTDKVELDAQTPPLNWLTVYGEVDASITVNSGIVARSVIVYGKLYLGTVQQPIPLAVTSTLSLWGSDADHTVVVGEGLFLGSKTLAVLGEFSAVGTPMSGSRANAQARPAWTKLARTAEVGAASIVVKGNQTWWAAGSRIGIGSTEYPRIGAGASDPRGMVTESEVRVVSATPSYDAANDRTVVKIDAPLVYRHFSGLVGDKTAKNGLWAGGLELSASVALLGGRANVVINTHENIAQTSPPGHGGTVMVAGTQDGSSVGSATIIDAEFVAMGKSEYQHPALHFKYLHRTKAQPLSRVEHVIFSQSQAGAIVLNGVQQLDLIGNVFHRTYRSAVWVNKDCRRGSIKVVGNLALETLMHPKEATHIPRPFAAFMLEVAMGQMSGNVAAGSTDMGFVFEPLVWSCSLGAGGVGTPWAQPVQASDQNEAVGCVIGFFMKNPGGRRGSCARMRGAVAWKNSQIGIFTGENKASLRLEHLAVSDNNIGFSFTFIKPADGYKHRILMEHITILGSSDATANITLAPRRRGWITHMFYTQPKLCMHGAPMPGCFPDVMMLPCSAPYQAKDGTLASPYSETHFTRVTFGNFQKPSVAITFNPTASDLTFPMLFRGVKCVIH